MTSAPSPTGDPGRELELMLLALLAIVLGPFALAAGAALAALARSRPRLWLWLVAPASAGGAFLLYPFTRRHLEQALAAVHGSIAANPARAFAEAWPHLWPAWCATTTLTPLIALAIRYRYRPSRLARPLDESDRRRERIERRIERRSRTAREQPADERGAFLGHKLAGDGLLPTRRGRVHLPLPRLAHHLLVAGSTGSGKTETVLRLAYSLAKASDWTVIYIDGKGDRQVKERFAALMEDAGRRVALFPDDAYDGWRGSTEEIAGRLLQLIDFADEGGGTYYRDLAVNTVRLACDTASGPPRNSAELLGRLRRDALLKLHPKSSLAAAEVRALQREQLDAIRARYAAFFATVAGAIDGGLSFEQLDTGYFLLDGLRLKYEAGYLARFLVEEFTQWAVGRKARARHVLLIVDEFSAIAEAGKGLVDVVERTRGFGVAAVLCPQLAEGMGGAEAAARIIGSVQTILLHAMATPEQFVRAAGTKRVHFTTRQLEGDAFTGLGSTRVEHEYRVDPNQVRRLRVGQCFAIGSGLAMKLQIAPAPKLPSLPEPLLPEPVRA
jgi:Cdc6-like AAA superfamily ATPase